jgi:hypothetical protein
MVCVTSHHIFGSCIYLQDTKIRFNYKLNLTSVISTFCKSHYLVSYVFCHYAMAYDRVKRDLLKLKRIDRTINLANHFTKQLRWVLFHCHVDYIFGKVPSTYSSAFAQFSKHTHLTKSVPPKMLPETDPVWVPIAAASARLHTTWSYILSHTI